MNSRLFYLALTLMTPGISRASLAVMGTLAQEHRLSPGENFEGVILLRNTGSETETARIFQTDYAFAADGSNDFSTPGSNARSNARWLSVGSSLAQIAPGETAAVPYHGHVPTDATLAGSYWSIIMIENTTPLAAAPSAEGIKTIARYGVQIVTDLGDSGRRSVRFAKREVAHHASGSYLLVDLENDGQRLVFPKLWVEVYDQAGRKLGRFGGEAVRLYPSCSARYRVEVPGIPEGAYTALLMADCGNDQIVGTRVSLGL